eukprot:2616657-Amphidinium_carterae.1
MACPSPSSSRFSTSKNSTCATDPILHIKTPDFSEPPERNFFLLPCTSKGGKLNLRKEGSSYERAHTENNRTEAGSPTL